MGAAPDDFTLTYLSNPAAQLGTAAGTVETTDRLDTFAKSFQCIDEGTAGVTVAVRFGDVLDNNAAIVVGTLTVKRSELVLFPS